ncbi:MAG: hypothetical protein QOI73_2681 [Solirubrobacteraceae bacterium]|nr:hypothetical protein [Solirubrobacteraceae bacterium]
MSRHAILAIALAGAGVLGLIFTLSSHSSVREDIAKSYRKVGTEPPPSGDGKGRKRTQIYASNKSVTKTASEIADKHKPADRRAAESGVFLRYEDDVVAVVPPPAGSKGSRIFVDDEEGGYHRNFLFVGGFWGTYSGPAGSFRGGGPGTGK